MSQELQVQPMRRPSRIRKYDRPEIVARVMELYFEGLGLRGIRAKTGLAYGTIENVLKYNNADLRKTIVERVAQKLETRLGEYEELVYSGIKKTNDRHLAKEILVDVGVASAVPKPKQDQNEGGRIVIEWNGPPPPWAPKPVLDAYAARPVQHSEPEQKPIAELPEDATNR